MLFALFFGRDEYVIAIDRHVLLRDELEEIGPEDDGSASGAIAWSDRRSSIVQRQFREALGASDGLLDRVFSLGDLLGGPGVGVGRVPMRVR